MKDYYYEKYKKYSSLWLKYVSLGINLNPKYFSYADSLEIMMNLYYVRYVNLLTLKQKIMIGVI